MPYPQVTGLPAPGRTLIMGVVNVTPDSFSDGGEFLDPELAIAHGLELIAEGADVIDVGGESTRPGAVRPTTEVELRRVLPVVAALAQGGALVSIDTMRSVVAAAAIEAGAGASTTSPVAGPSPSCCGWSRTPSCRTSACTGAVTPPTWRAWPSTTTSSPR